MVDFTAEAAIVLVLPVDPVVVLLVVAMEQMQRQELHEALTCVSFYQVVNTIRSVVFQVWVALTVSPDQIQISGTRFKIAIA